ncbi:hypothetical protein BO71DRAFT_434179 [Aspergillus ellipticus CBS 707.79]|uniref:Uncharacterized protein n=1 Tax=Aspergillus ellipticus CBS 707.79 TaxID=1448320 RepID=A0A319CXN8_9EURO|nr:hypothetical protein BO71DRAFT_434179 [Aspergillus ellipticus CBS 707.79]
MGHYRRDDAPKLGEKVIILHPAPFSMIWHTPLQRIGCTACFQGENVNPAAGIIVQRCIVNGLEKETLLAGKPGAPNFPASPSSSLILLLTVLTWLFPWPTLGYIAFDNDPIGDRQRLKWFLSLGWPGHSF